MVVVVIFSIFFFQDRPTIHQIAGIIAAIVVILLLTREPADAPPSADRIRRGFILVFISLTCGAIASISSKFAAMRTNPLAFMAVSYLLSSLFALGLKNKLPSETAQANYREALIIGLIIGIINFAGYYAFLKALALGPLSIVISIISLHFAIAILLSVVIYKEKVTPARNRKQLRNPNDGKVRFPVDHLDPVLLPVGSLRFHRLPGMNCQYR